MLDIKKLIARILQSIYKNDTNQILWSGGMYMNAAQTAYLSQNVSAQNKGIVLVWSEYSGGAQNYGWQYFFIPKSHVLRHIGTGVCMTLSSSGFGYVGTKYVYIHDNKIVGNNANAATGTGSNIKYTNSRYVLRYVIGV